jgi:hypothetical protein
MTEHTLKCWPVYFDAIKRGEKTFEIRKDDRGFQKGDVLVLQRTRTDRLFQVDTKFRTGTAMHEIRAHVLWILTGGQFGLEPGYVCMSIAVENSHDR